MFLAAVLNAYLQSTDAAAATPSVDLSANDDAAAVKGLALANVRANPVRAEQSAGVHADARQIRARW